MLVLLNPTAGGGRASHQWRRCGPELAQRFGRLDVLETGDPRHTRDRIADALRRGERRFVAAGGDGTVNLLIGMLTSLAPAELITQVTVGAVGLGSSNDFHKPFRNGALDGGVPCRLDFDATLMQDVGVLLHTDENGVARRRYWISNASIGVTADGNQRFNTPDPVLRLLKRVATGPAIGYAALRALLAHRSRWMTLQTDTQPTVTVSVSNLGVVKNPHFAGSLRYDSPPEPVGGRFFVHVLEGQPLPRLLAALFDLSRGRFMGREGSRSFRAARLAVEAADAFAIEVDGEVVVARRACFALLPHHLRVCP